MCLAGDPERGTVGWGWLAVALAMIVAGAVLWATS